MELLSFPLLILEFIKHQADLATRGYHLELKMASNIFQDQFVISKIVNGKTFHFMLQHRLWDRYHEFSVNLGSPFISNLGSAAVWYHYRLNPINLQVIQVQRGSGYYDNGYNPWSLQNEFSGELRDFSEEILRMINHLIEKVQSDKVNLDSSEVV
jgi:hypothetical protein